MTAASGWERSTKIGWGAHGISGVPRPCRPACSTDWTPVGCSRRQGHGGPMFATPMAQDRFTHGDRCAGDLGWWRRLSHGCRGGTCPGGIAMSLWVLGAAVAAVVACWWELLPVARDDNMGGWQRSTAVVAHSGDATVPATCMHEPWWGGSGLWCYQEKIKEGGWCWGRSRERKSERGAGPPRERRMRVYVVGLWVMRKVGPAVAAQGMGVRGIRGWEGQWDWPTVFLWRWNRMVGSGGVGLAGRCFGVVGWKANTNNNNKE